VSLREGESKKFRSHLLHITSWWWSG